MRLRWENCRLAKMTFDVKLVRLENWIIWFRTLKHVLANVHQSASFKENAYICGVMSVAKIRRIISTYTEPCMLRATIDWQQAETNDKCATDSCLCQGKVRCLGGSPADLDNKSMSIDHHTQYSGTVGGDVTSIHLLFTRTLSRYQSTAEQCLYQTSLSLNVNLQNAMILTPVFTLTSGCFKQLRSPLPVRQIVTCKQGTTLQMSLHAAVRYRVILNTYNK